MIDYTLTTCVFCLLLLCVQLFRTRYRKDFSAIPGPLIASFSNLWKLNAVYKGDMPRKNIAIHKKYGPVVRIGPNHVSFASPQAFQIIHGSRQAFAKSDFYTPTIPYHNGVPLFHLFSIQNVEYHASLKRTITGLYTKSAMRDFEPQIDSCLELFLEQLLKFAEGGASRINMSLWLHFFAFDCLGEVNVSKKFGFLETGTDIRGMIARANYVLHITGLYAQTPILNEVQKIIRSFKTNPILEYSFSQVEQRRKNPQENPDMLNKFLKLRDAQPEKLSIEELAGAIYINLMAGHDVLAITLRAIFYYLARSPNSMSKLRDEIETATKDASLNKAFPYDLITELPYLNAVINEALRIHPNTGLILERVVPVEGAIIDGYALPGGTVVGVNSWVLHRNKEIFGDDVDVFRPERWLETPEQKSLEMKRYLFSFGAGPRMCIGRNLAMMQISKAVVEFYRRFDAVLADPDKDWYVHGSWVTKQTDMDMILKPLKV